MTRYLPHRRVILKHVKEALVAVYWVLIFLALIIPNATSFWNPNL